MSSKFGRVFMAISGMVMAGVVLAPVPAQAKSTSTPLGTKTKTYSYTKNVCSYNKTRKIAVRIQLSGKLQYTRTAVRWQKGIRVMFHNPAVVDPKLTATALTKCSNGKNVKKSYIYASQSWYAYKCETTSFSVNSPWYKSGSATQNCGNRVDAAFRYGQRNNVSSMTLYDKGKKASWNWGADGKYIKPGGFICMNVDVYAEASTVADQGRATYSVCVPASRA